MEIILHGHTIAVSGPMVVVGLWIDSVALVITIYVRKRRVR